jgi:hypothetical protein
MAIGTIQPAVETADVMTIAAVTVAVIGADATMDVRARRVVHSRSRQRLLRRRNSSGTMIGTMMIAAKGAGPTNTIRVRATMAGRAVIVADVAGARTRLARAS